MSLISLEMFRQKHFSKKKLKQWWSTRNEKIYFFCQFWHDLTSWELWFMWKPEYYVKVEALIFQNIETELKGFLHRKLTSDML